MSNADETPTLSIPSLAILALFAFLLYRYLLSSNTSSSTSPSSSLSAAEQRRTGLHFTPAQVEQVAQMFPQLGRREIMWDLQRNRGSVQATVERIMGGRGLDVAPPSFQPRLPTPPPTNVSSSPTNTTSTSKSTGPDLITRYNLHSRVESSDKGKEKEVEVSSGWAATKDARQQMLLRRRDEMILAARRRMLEKDELK